ncbi:unnamed protein product [Adineta ricciae]|uniref:Protein kinase domain-containing protein n=2 Tax=Adineta ricciae TaxID=249248 RepID=A0A813QT88_ADIRI|nr:unnamed protein product [Adineta ricciae]CAF1521265.1 unnamed protein product [Adineta ricciae]
MGPLKVVLLTESDSLKPDVNLPYKYYGQKLWETIRTVVEQLQYRCESVELHKLDFQEHESVNKYLSADIVIMDVTNQDRRPTFMYHKGNRESMDCLDDIVLIQASGVENDSAIQDLKTTCKIKRLIVYRYDESKNVFYDTTQPANPFPLLSTNLNLFLKRAADNIQKGLADRYISRMNTSKAESQDDNTYRQFLWNEVCDEILNENNHESATPKLITKLMYAFRDIQDYESMIKLNERCEQLKEIGKRIKTNMMISYLTAFARSRRNQPGDRDEALNILERLCQTKKTESELSNDIICLCGRIYKDKYTESSCTDQESLEKAIEWYRRGYAADPNIHAGINLLFLLAIKIEDLKNNNEAYRIIIQLNALLGKKGRSLRDLTNYWDVATYFELHAVQRDWSKACLAALHMYLLNPPIWYLKSTINNLKILHQATRMRDKEKLREQLSETTDDENVYSFWIDFFTDAINSNSTSSEERELPAQVPILVCDNYEKHDGTTLKNVYVESHLQLNFHTGSEPETLVIYTLAKPSQAQVDVSVRTIHMDSIRSIINVKRDNRSVFLYAYENAEAFLSVELQIFFSSVERRIAFNEKMSKYRVQTNIPEVEPKFDLVFDRDPHEQRTALGQGTYGKVYVAHDRNTWKKFAVKEIPMRNPVYTDVLENEIKILSTLSHKNIVTYYGSVIDRSKKQSVFQIIMEYVDGGSLSQHLSKFGQFQEPVIRNYTRQLLEGLQYLHENHILHRDIKSANILVNSRGEIKIADFGTSKRLAGLQLCTEDSVGTLQYMSPDVVLVPPMGYGPEVDIWSVGCTVIEMATGKMPFHKVVNAGALLLKLGSERQPPDIPPELSDTAKDFLSKCFEPTDKRPSAKDLLNHPFFKLKLARDNNGKNGGEKGQESSIHVSDCSLPYHRSFSEEAGVLEPAKSLEPQVSIDDRRRSELMNIIRDNDSREDLLGQWMDLIDEKNETEVLTIDKLRILLSGICEYLEDLNERSLQIALEQICDNSTLDSDSRTDLERSFYLFIKATNTVLSSKNGLPPHVLFALDNVIRRVAEHLVGFIRPDFLPAVSNITPITPSDSTTMSSTNTRSPLFLSINEGNNEEMARLHQLYLKLVHANREQLNKLITIESNNSIKLNEIMSNQKNDNSPSKTVGLFLPVEPSPENEITSADPSTIQEATEEKKRPTHLTPMAAIAKQATRSRTLVTMEQEHDQLLKSLLDNRTRLNQLLNSANI